MGIRTNLHIEDDALAYASAYAKAKGIPLGVAVSELIRCAEQMQHPKSTAPRLVMNRHGYLEIAATGGVITPEIVKDASEDALA